MLAGYHIMLALNAHNGIYHTILTVPLPSSTHVANRNFSPHCTESDWLLNDSLYQVDEYICCSLRHNVAFQEYGHIQMLFPV